MNESSARKCAGSFSDPCPNPAPGRYPLLNTYVNNLTLKETVVEVEKIIARKTPVQHVVINASKINLMRDDAALTSIVNQCPLINADGASIVWAAKTRGLPISERVTGIDLFLNLVEVAAEKSYTVYLFGAKEEVIQETKTKLELRYPSLCVVGYRNGYFNEDEVDDIVADMASSGADMLFVAFSSPKKEYWIHENLEKLNIPFVMGVGGSFDVVAGVTQRAPKWIQEGGFEWLYRFIQEPKRLWRRYIIGNIRFVSYVLASKYGKDRGGLS